MRCCKYLSAGAILFLLTSSVYAISLKDAIGEALETNPVVKERRKNFNETQQDLEIAKSEWLPSVDLQSSIGRVNSGKFKDKNKNYSHFVDSTAYNHYTNSLKLTQNLFRGFSTTQKINYQQTRILAAANHYIESANDIAFQMVGAYIDVIRSYRLLQNAKDNVEINKKIFEDVDALYQQGLTTKSEMTKIYASLSLANSNLIVWQNNTIDKEARFKRLLGRSVNVASLTLPNLNFAMPESKERAAQIAIQNNPSILVSKYNIQGAQALYREKKSKFYPTIDLEAEQVFNDYSKGQTLDSPDDRQRVYLVLNWNLYSGGAHKADLQKSRSTIYKETEIQRDLKRQILEGLELSWNAYDLLGNQLEELYKYYEFSLETLENYKDEYDMGRRTLLDLLTAQNDLINSKSQIINAQLDKLFAQYRILDAMGLLVQSTVDSAQYNKIIHPTLNPFDITKDELPVNKDIDGDGIVDSLDICDNSILGNDDITPYGCSQKEKDSDFDGVPDSLDKCPDTPFGAIVDEHGCEIDSKQNRYLIQDETYIKPVAKHDVQSPKKESTKGLYDYEFN
ncbi:MAG: TolC family outer membrane protein, partial [Sulfurospirillaceae bacterium]|nr:TolC family outer membrane protein [Sulfurospirillaceae bacterium]